jgi:hypothetical protein
VSSHDMKLKQRQDWTVGSLVKIGFMQLRVISGKIPTPGNYHGDEYALESLDSSRFYRFTPHAGCFRCESRNEALHGAANY